MTDATQEDIRDLTEALNKSSGVFGRIPDMIKSREEAKADAIKKTFDKFIDSGTRTTERIDTVSDHLRILAQDAGQLSKAFQSTFRKGVFGAMGGAVASNMMEWAGDLTDTYRDLSNVGQSFSTGLLEMSATAGHSGVTLTEFSRVLKNHSIVAAQMSAKSFMGLAREVRRGTEAFGMYGYSVEALNDLTGDYMENVRVQGRMDEMQRLGQAALASKMNDLAKNVAIVSAAYGKSREEILKANAAAAQESMTIVRLSQMSAQERAEWDRNVVPALNAAFGAGGEELQKYLQQSLAGGNATMTEMGTKLAQEGMGNINAMVDAMRQDVIKGNISSTDFVNTVVKELQGNLSRPGNMGLLMSGDSTLDSLIQSISKMQVVSEQQLAQAEEAVVGTDAVSNAILAMGNQMEGIMGDARAVLIDGLHEALMLPAIQDQAKNLNSFLTDFTGVTQNLSGDFSKLFEEIRINGLPSLDEFFAKLGSMPSLDALTDLLSNSSPIIKFITEIGLAAVGVAALAKGLGILVAFFGAKSLLMKSLELFSGQMGALSKIKIDDAMTNAFRRMTLRNMTVNAGVVNVYGRGGSGGLPETDGGRRRSRTSSRRSRGRAGRIGGGVIDGIGAIDDVIDDAGAVADIAETAGDLAKSSGKLGTAAKIVGNAGRIVGTGAAAVGAGLDLYNAYDTQTTLQDKLAKGEITQKEYDDATTSNATNTAVPFAGAAAGAAIGSAFFGVGAVPGAAIGYGVGTIANWVGLGDKLAEWINDSDESDVAAADHMDDALAQQRAEMMSSLPSLVLPMEELPDNLRTEFTSMLDKMSQDKSAGADITDDQQRISAFVDDINTATRIMNGDPERITEMQDRLQDRYDAIERSMTEANQNGGTPQERDRSQKTLDDIAEQLRILTALQSQAIKTIDRRGRDQTNAILDMPM